MDTCANGQSANIFTMLVRHVSNMLSLFCASHASYASHASKRGSGWRLPKHYASPHRRRWPGSGHGGTAKRAVAQPRSPSSCRSSALRATADTSLLSPLIASDAPRPRGPRWIRNRPAARSCAQNPIQRQCQLHLYAAVHQEGIAQLRRHEVGLAFSPLPAFCPSLPAESPAAQPLPRLLWCSSDTEHRAL